jgi:predicted transcriptional regulator
LKAAGDDINSKLSGIKIFSDIANLKVGATKKTKEIKDTMTKVIVEATEDSQVEEAMAQFEIEAKKIADDLTVNIASETIKGKDL